MNLNQKLIDAKPLEQRLEQPIDLAQKSSLTNQQSVVTGHHQVAMHAQIDGNKLPFPTLRMPMGPRLSATSGSQSIISSSKSLVRASSVSDVSSASILSQGSAMTRQVMNTTVYPVMSLGGGNVPMASIIREAHTMPLYSSHVPRGPAAVASISAGPKSAVATPMMRQTNSSVMPRTATLINRMVNPAKTIGSGPVPQSIDVPKIGLTTSHSSAVQLGYTSDNRTFDSGGVRTAAMTTAGKPVHISQPIAQHIQQVPDKGYYKAGTTILTASQAHLISSSGSSSLGLPLTSSPSSVRLNPPTACVVTIAPGSALRTSGSQQSALHLGQTHSSIISNQALTLISGKSISHVLAPGQQTALTPNKTTEISAIKKVNPATNTSANSLTRTIQVTAGQAAGIPVAKVYPQPVTPPRSAMNIVNQDGARGSIYIAHPAQNVGGAATNATNLGGTTVVLQENRNDSGPIRFATIPRSTTGTPYAVPPTAYYYEPYQVQNTISMHPYAGGSSSNQSFPATTLSSSASLRPVGIAVSEVVTHSGGPPQSTMYTVTTSAGHSSGSSLIPSQFNSGQNSNQVLHTNHVTSPRPSILRKRTSDGVSASVKKNLISSLTSLPSSRTSPTPLNHVTNKTIQAKAATEILRENSCPNVETLEKVPPPINIKTVEQSQETNDKVKKLSPCPPASNGIPLAPSLEASPRKKPRKQQLAAIDLLESHSTDGEDGYEKKRKDNFRKELMKDSLMQLEEESSKWVTFCKRPTMSLLNSYRNTWKSRHNHFLKYTDVKPKDEKKSSVNELVNQKGVLKKVNGWKIYHLTTQMDEVVECEDHVHAQISSLLSFIETTPVFKRSLSTDEEKVLGKVTDLIKGNLQRSKIIQDQVSDVKQQMVKVLDHKQNIVNIVGKYISKRPIKKKN